MTHHIMTGTHSPTHAPHLTGASFHNATSSHPSVSTFFFGKSPSQSTGVLSILTAPYISKVANIPELTSFLPPLKKHYLHSFS